MSIATVMTAIGTFLSGPIMTGISNVASLGTLGVSIATKVDTHDIKSSVGGLRSDIASVSNDVLALSGDIADFRKERQWTTAINGGVPVSVVNGGNPQYVQLQIQPQAQAVQQVVQPVQQPAQQSQAAPTPQYITKDEINTVLNNFTNSIPTMVARAIQQAQAMTPTVANPTPANPTPAPAPEEKPGDNTKG
jgi:hypothetical protein